jgi:quercetin dioxygenase-like cupin family protein
MENINRRDLCVLLSAFTALAATPGEAQTAATPAPSTPPAPRGGPVLSKSISYPFDKLPVTENANGQTRTVTRGVLVTGEAVGVHETTLLPGHSPHPPHQHIHSEFMLIREGTIEFENNGKPELVGPGGVIFAASMVLHGLKNVGDTNATYFVVEIGRDTPA